MKRIITLLALLISTEAHSCPPGMPCGALSEDDLHKETDENHDGFVSLDEYTLHYYVNENYRKTFECADKNKDNKLDVVEFRETTYCSQSLTNNKEIDDILQKTVEENNKTSKIAMICKTIATGLFLSITSTLFS
jgi:Ca2+-binding EF-hand superfamily protein